MNDLRIPGRSGPWHLLIHDNDPDDPKLILATVAGPDDVRPAGPDVDDVGLAWVAARCGLDRPSLTAMPGAQCWRIDGQE